MRVAPSAPRVTTSMLDPLQDARLIQAGLLLDHLQLVVVDRQRIRALHAGQHLLPIQPGKLLAGVEDEADAQLAALGAVAAASPRIVGRDDDVVDRRSRPGPRIGQLAAAAHRARVEAGDLVLFQVGDDGEGGGELAGIGDDQRRVDPLRSSQAR